MRLKARLLVDASGPRGFLHNALGLPETGFPGLSANEGLYTHFEGVRRLADLERFSFASGGGPPYPIDDAAVHHVFDGGWVWVLRFNNGVTSAGVAATRGLAGELELPQGEAAWARLLERFPSLREQFAKARPVRPFIHSPRLPFRSAVASGPGWILLPSAAAFVDPLLSTGFPLTLLGIDRLARAIAGGWGDRDLDSTLSYCAAATLEEADTTGLLVSALYASFADFELFSALTLLYFAAASYAEAARRLSRPELAGSFLSGNHESFGPALRRCCSSVLEARALNSITAERNRLIDDVYDAIEPLDVAGLSDKSRRNWHPVEARPMLSSAHRLRATRGEIETMLLTTGFFPAAAESAPAAGRLRLSRALHESAPRTFPSDS